MLKAESFHDLEHPIGGLCSSPADPQPDLGSRRGKKKVSQQPWSCEMEVAFGRMWPRGPTISVLNLKPLALLLPNPELLPHPLPGRQELI